MLNNYWTSLYSQTLYTDLLSLRAGYVWSFPVVCILFPGIKETEVSFKCFKYLTSGSVQDIGRKFYILDFANYSIFLVFSELSLMQASHGEHANDFSNLNPDL